MSFLLAAAISYILGGVSLIIDKNLVNHSLKHPTVYTFYIGVLGLATLILIPFYGFSIPNSTAIAYASLSGVIFGIALLAMFQSLRTFNLSVASPIIGTLNPVVSLVIGYIFLNELLSGQQFLAFFFLIFGGIILTFNLWWGKHKFSESQNNEGQSFLLHNKPFILMLTSGFLFGLSYILLHESFQSSGFIEGLVFSRIAMLLLVLTFLFFPITRTQIFSSKLTKNHFANKTSYLVFFSQAAGAISGFLLAFAISKENPALVNSLFGLQYIIVLLAALFLAKKHPEVLEENFSRKILIQKVLGTVVIIAGLILLAV